MTTIVANPLAILYHTKDTASWPTLSMHQQIPRHLAAKRASPTRPSHVGPGIVKGICAILTTGRVIGLAQAHAQWSLCLQSGSGNQDHYLGGNAPTWYIDHHGYLAAVVALTDALTIDSNHPRTQDLRGRYADLLLRLRTFFGAPPPYTADQLAQRAAYDVGLTEAMMSVSDELWFWCKERLPDLTMIVEQPDANVLPTMAGERERVFYGQVAPTPAAPLVTPTQIQTPLRILTRLIERGGTALLFGPTGVGKSALARMAVRDQGVRLVKTEGRPGLDDKQLYGGTRAVQGGFRWVDGPLSKAWRLAANGERVALIVDELARFDPWHLAALIGAIDPVNADDLLLMDEIPPDALAYARAHAALRYYVLTLPTGEIFVAPTNRLSIIATTNLGADYLQTQQAFDAALLRRFALHLDIERLDAATRQQLLQDLGLSSKVARLMVSIEDFSVTQTDQAGGLLKRELNLGTLLNWATETLAQVEDGVRWSQAVLSAAKITAIPFVCDRDDFGRLEVSAAEGLRQQIESLIATYGI